MDMSRIVFNTKPILVEHVLDCHPPELPKTLESVGAILEGKLLSLN